MSLAPASDIVGTQKSRGRPLGLLLVALPVLLVFWMVPYAIVRVRRGDLRGHKRTVTQLIIAMIIVGGLTMLPGHLLHPVFFTAAS